MPRKRIKITVVFKTRTGSKEYIYNTMLLKLYKEAPKSQTPEKPQTNNPSAQKVPEIEVPIRKYEKRTFEGREDGGPVTKSREPAVQSASSYYSEVLQKPKLLNSKPSVK